MKSDEQIMHDLQADLLRRIKAGEKCGPFFAWGDSDIGLHHCPFAATGGLTAGNMV